VTGVRVPIVISAGGVLWSLARYALGLAFPHTTDGFGWATFAVNLSGCFLIGVLMVLVTDVWPDRTLLRPFVGVGVLGGYTTFSAYIVDIVGALRVGAGGVAAGYLLGTVVGAMAAVWLATVLTRRIVQPASAPQASGATP